MFSNYAIKVFDVSA